MDDLQILQNYRWAVRERETLAAQLEELSSPHYRRAEAEGRVQAERARARRQNICAQRLQAREDDLARQTEAFERVLDGVILARTRLVLRQYYALGWTDEEIAEANGFSARLANHIRNQWLRERGITPRRRERTQAGRRPEA